MLNFSSRRFCFSASKVGPAPAFQQQQSQQQNQRRVVHQHGNFNPAFETIAGELSSLHNALIRREGSPKEIRRQAQYLFASQGTLRALTPDQVSGDKVCDLAVQIASFVPTIDDAPTVDFFPRVASVFSHHLNSVDHHLSPLPDRFGGATGKSGRLQTSFHHSSHDDAGGGQSSQQQQFESQYTYVAHDSNPEAVAKQLDLEQLPSNAARLCSSVVECIVSLSQPGSRSIKHLPSELVVCLNQALGLAMRVMAREAALGVPTGLHSLGDEQSNAAHQQQYPRCSARHVISFLQGADLQLGGRDSFHFKARGVAPLPMLPIKSKHDMERKAQKFPLLRDLLRELERRSEQITRIDAHVSLRTLAVVGVYSAPVVDACVQRIMNSIDLCSDRQLADVVGYLGVLGHRHVDARALAANCGTKSAGARGIRTLMRGRAMLQMPFKTQEEKKKAHDHIWLYAMRPQDQAICTVEWHIDICFALAAMQSMHYKLLLRTCRLLRNKTRGYNLKRAEIPLSELHRAKLLWTLGQVKNRTDVPEELDRPWKENVNRVKNALKTSALGALASADPESAALLFQGLEAIGVEHEEIERHRAAGLSGGLWKSADSHNMETH